MKIIAPSRPTETGEGKLPKGYEEYSISSSAFFPEQKKYFEILDAIGTKQLELEKRVVKAEKNIKNQTFKIIEIVGLFSAILALVLIDVSIINQAQTFLGAILLISALTCSLAIFAILMHSLFSGRKINWKQDWRFLIPFIILSVLVITGIIFYFYEQDLYK